MPQSSQDEFSFKGLFVPLTTFKAIHIIIIVGVLVYGNALFNGFVWDDLGFILSNPDVKSFNISHLFGNNMFNQNSYYRPIPAVYFTLLYNLFGQEAFFYHFLQITLHIVNTCLLFFVFNKFMGKPFAFFAAIVFLIHPANVESVAYIGATQSELFFLFGISSLLLSMKEKLSGIRIISLFGLLLLSLLSKETGFIFLIIILLYQFFYKKSRLFSFFLGALIIAIGYFCIRFFIGNVFFDHFLLPPITRISLGERVLHIPEIFLYYLKTIFFPIELAINQQWTIPEITINTFLLPLIIDSIFLSGLIIIGLYIKKHKKNYIKPFNFFALWFLLGIGFLMQIFPLDMTVAERWLYLPLAGFLGLLGIVIQIVPLKKYNSLVAIILVIVLLGFSTRTIMRNTNWQSGLTLYEHDLPLSDNFDNRNSYAVLLTMNAATEVDKKSKYSQALIHMEKSVEQYAHERNLLNLGVGYVNLGEKQKAVTYFNRALQSTNYESPQHKHNKDTYKKIASFYFFNDEMHELKRISQAGVKDYPTAADLWVLLALSEYKLQNHQSALAAAKKAYSLNPNNETLYLKTTIQNKQPVSINNGKLE